MKIIFRILLIILFFILLFIFFIFIAKIYVLKNPRDYTQKENKDYNLPKKFQHLNNKLTTYTMIPGLDEGAVPQGIAYYGQENLLITTSYHKGNKATSVIHIINYQNGQLIKNLLLYQENGKPYTGHAGGIAISNNKMWISSNYEILEYELSDVLKLKNMEKIIATDHYKISNKADFLAFFDNTLFVGEYNYKYLYKTSKSHNVDEYKSLLYAYDLKNDLKINDNNIKYVIPLPDRVQGMVITDDKIILSRSFWSFQDSEINIYDNPINDYSEKYFKLNDKEIPIYYLNREIAMFKVMPMSEGITLIDNFVYILFESNSNLYKYYTEDKTCYIMSLSLN